MKSRVMPIPIDGELAQMIEQAAKQTGLKQADVMRQGLRHGVPRFLERMRAATVQREPKSLAFLDDYPKSPVAARDYKKALREKLAKKYGRANR
jgi:hypothetical protein